MTAARFDNSVPLTLDDLIQGWPPWRPLAAVTRMAAGWSFVAEPQGTFRCRGPSAGARAGPACRCEWVDTQTGLVLEPPVSFSHDPLRDLERITAAFGAPELPRSSSGVPRFCGGWIGYLSYDLGRLIEPKAQHARCALAEGWPLIEFHHCPDGFQIDHATGRIEWTGDPARKPSLVHPGLRRGQSARVSECGFAGSDAGSGAAYERDVSHVLEHIRAGDVYQVNLAHRLTASFSGSPRNAFIAMHRAAAPWYGAYIEGAFDVLQPGRRTALLSMSPELFLEIQPRPDSTNRITTRPMKGTRPAPPRGDPDELLASSKDRAELDMIVDLMRNDLGRVCQPGTVRVDEPRNIERHGCDSGEGQRAGGGVLQATATVSGTLRLELGLSDVLRATFPPGSVTGAPKIRAMQIIDQLESKVRGPYCGASGYISPTGHVSLNVAIRTAMISGMADVNDVDQVNHIKEGEVHYSVGAGIVADSIPASEWQETLDKAGILRSLANDCGSEEPLVEAATQHR